MRDKRYIPLEEEKRRMKLYRQGLTDTEIARAIGANPTTIGAWRNSRRLPSNQKLKDKRTKMTDYKFRTAIGAPMEEALTPAQCKIMRRFLSALLKAHEMNLDLDISNFMKEYRFMLNGRYQGRGVVNG